MFLPAPKKGKPQITYPDQTGQPLPKPKINFPIFIEGLLDGFTGKKKNKGQNSSQKPQITYPKPGLLPKPGGLITYPDNNTPSYPVDPSKMKTIIPDSDEGYYYEPIYGYSAEPWGPGLVDTFRGSGLPDPFFV